ncbi:MAG: hypothetical protein J6U34_08770 [Bacteroidales bacterium]|nr:hypothetical protein [Bacteroidales bacterium]
MKRIFSITLAALMFTVLLSCEKVENVATPDTPKEEQGQNNEEPGGSGAVSGKTLVVYYSFTGNCRSIVNSLTANIDADVMEILPAEEGLDYAANNYAIGSSLIAAIREKPNAAASYPAIKPVTRNAADYENIIIVTPLWWSNMAAIMQSYLFKEGAKMKGKNVGLIVSSHSSGIASVVADAKRLLPGVTWLGDALWINNNNRAQSESLVSGWWNGFTIKENAMPSEIIISVSGKTMPVKIVDNVATRALVDALRGSSITYEASDYGGFEKVGALGRSLPTADSQMQTQAGDVVLYNGNQIVLFYGSNSWSYTRIGKMEYGSLDALKSFLKAGQGKITVTLSVD